MILDESFSSITATTQNITNYRGEEVKDKEMRVYGGTETKKLHGNKRIGDKILVEVTRGGFANSVE